MHQFYVPDADCFRRCEESLGRRRIVTVSGIDPITSNLNMYTGVVLTIQDIGPTTPSGRRWLVTIRE